MALLFLLWSLLLIIATEIPPFLPLQSFTTVSKNIGALILSLKNRIFIELLIVDS